MSCPGGGGCYDHHGVLAAITTFGSLKKSAMRTILKSGNLYLEPGNRTSVYSNAPKSKKKKSQTIFLESGSFPLIEKKRGGDGQ